MKDSTISYYDDNAEQYFESTVCADFDVLRRKFVSYLPEKARIIDIGCGSGRDVKAFCDMGYRAVGLDASKELAELARKRLGIEVIVDDMATWKATDPFDGMWCCASLLHLHDEDAEQFFQNLRYNLKPSGIAFFSVKDGITTGLDKKSRYMRNYTEEEVRKKLDQAGFMIVEVSQTIDKLGRDGFHWINMIAKII